jgi:glycosyltransferase involved in cell wall biosynthesis
MFWTTIAAHTLELPVVVWSHWFPLPRDGHFEAANRALYRWVDAFVALGHRHRLALIRNAHVPAGRIVVIRNAIDVERFARGHSREEARRRLRLEAHHVAVGLIANMRPEKRHDVFIEAARRLAADNPDYRFLVIGDGPHRDAVQAAAAASGMDHEVLRLLGAREDVAELLPGIDISCLCSEVECFSVTMLEAAVAGCAFIGPDVGSLPEHLEHGVTGLVIKPADVGSLADSIQQLGSDPDLRRRLVAAAQDRVVKDFTVGKMVRSFVDLFASLSRRGKRPPAVRGNCGASFRSASARRSAGIHA